MMNPFLKRSAGSAISSEDKLFLKARLKLTVLYTLFVSLIVASLSALLYYELVINVTDSFGDQLSVGSPQEYALQETLEKLRMSLVMTDVVIILIVAILAYFFARQTLRPIRTSLEIQKRFAADASHELRTPLTVMKTELEVALRDSALKPKQMQAVFRSALEEVEHMSLLTEQLLFLSRIGTQLPAPSAPVDLSRLAEHVIAKMKKIAEKKHLAITSDIEPGVRVSGQAHDLERVLYNLLQNAITHTERGSIQVRLAQGQDGAALSVQDTGAGIPPEHLPHIFDRFYKADSARDSHKGGAGLGLAIVREIMQRHGGTIDVTSEAGEGSVFTLHFTRI
jgi:two-component system sensor histidine kinase CiaH